MKIVRPLTLQGVLEALAMPGAQILAGGTNVMVDMKKGRLETDLLVSSDSLVQLQEIRREKDSIMAGSLATFDAVESCPLFAVPAYDGLTQAAAAVGGPQIRNRGTLGGNILCASPASDTVAAMLVLDAKLHLTDLQGQYCLPLDGFITGVRSTAKKPGQLLTAIEFPERTGRSCFYKVGNRKAMAISVVSEALYVECSDGIVSHVRIALGSVGSVVLRAVETEQLLEGKTRQEIFAPEFMSKVRASVQNEISPISDLRAEKSYRQMVAANILEANLKHLLGGDDIYGRNV